MLPVTIITNPKFPLGEVVITTNASTKLDLAEITAGIIRHAQGDWGDIDKEDRKENEVGLRRGFRLMSVYRCANGISFWIITEADRSVTTILLPEDY